MCLHNQVKAIHQDFDFIYTDGSVLDEKAAAATIIDNSSSIERRTGKSYMCLAELHARYI